MYLSTNLNLKFKNKYTIMLIFWSNIYIDKVKYIDILLGKTVSTYTAGTLGKLNLYFIIKCVHFYFIFIIFLTT